MPVQQLIAIEWNKEASVEEDSAAYAIILIENSKISLQINQTECLILCIKSNLNLIFELN